VGIFTGKFFGGLDVGFGYDTRGLSQFLDNFNPASLLNGFFLNDVDPATGQDRDEAFFGVELAVGAGIDLGIAKAGVEAGFAATILFNFADLDQDTKIRGDELAANLLANSFNPISVFDVSGKLEIFLRAFFEVLFLKLEFEFARLTLFEFDIPFERPAIMGSVSGDTLTLNIGPSAMNRLNGDTSDGNETIFVEETADKIRVWGDQFSRSNLNAQEFDKSSISKIVADGGAGNDVINLIGVTTKATEIRGGQGNDQITGGNGPNMLFGDGGRDILIGGTGRDELFGGEGDDDLRGDAGNDLLFGEAGNDTLDGGPDDDVLDGGAGDNVYERSAGSDNYTLLATGSTQFINGVGSDGDEIDLTELFGSELVVPQSFVVFIKDGSMLIGTGVQSDLWTVEQILDETLTYNNAGEVEGFFEHQVYVKNIDDLVKLTGGERGDTFYVVETAADATEITIDGGIGPDRYFLIPGSTDISARIQDNGEGLGELNQIIVLSQEGFGDPAVVEQIKITESDITLDAGVGNQVVRYESPAGVQDTDQLDG
jgi:Ca2+-binding RTX toxin-like protein